MSWHFYLRVWLYGLLCCSISVSGAAQSGIPGEDPFSLNNGGNSSVFLQVFSSNDAASGSPWFSPVWIHGKVEFADGYRLPQPGEVLYLNFNKYSNRLYAKTPDSIIALQVSAVRSFDLNDSLGNHHFVRLPEVDKTDFFEELTDNTNGFTLYRLRMSRLRSSDSARTGSRGPGKISTHYVDENRYFLFGPDKKESMRFFLSGNRIRKKLSRLNAIAARFLEDHPGRITHQMLLRLCDVLNEDISPR